MVQIVNRFSFEIFVVLMLIITHSSCSILRNDTECKLIPEQNVIIGKDKKAKRFGSNNNNHYMPRVIEQLRYNNSYILSNYQEPLPQHAKVDSLTNQIRMVDNPNAVSKLRSQYIIEGCADTTWAKKRMATHLMDKYRLTRIDSFYIKDFFTYSFNQDSIHLLTPHDPSSHIIWGVSTSRGNKECIGCTIEDFIATLLSERGFSYNGGRSFELKTDESFHDQELLKNSKFNLKFFFKKYMEFEESNIASSLSNEFGILLTHERTDTLKMGYYIYDGDE